MDAAPLARIDIQMRRAAWYGYISKRFDLVSFRDLADWISREPNGIDRSEGRRRQALRDLEQSIAHGEFGPKDKRSIPWLPKPPRTDMLGSLCLRLNYGQIVAMGDNVIADLWAAKPLCVRWMTARGMSLPPWLMNGESQSEAALSRDISRADSKKPLFDSDKANFLAAAMKASGELAERPSREEMKGILSRHYAKVSRQQADSVVNKIWGRGTTGPKKSPARRRN